MKRSSRSMKSYQGHPIAMVVATSPEIAELAVKSCSAEIEELPINICPRVAFKRGIAQETRVFEKGNVDAIWDECDHVVQNYRFSRARAPT